MIESFDLQLVYIANVPRRLHVHQHLAMPAKLDLREACHEVAEAWLYAET